MQAVSTSTEAELQKARVRSAYDRAATDYDKAPLRFFAFCADRMVSRLRPGAGEKLLDVATGTGVAAVAAAQRVYPQGRVTAIDFSEVMLERAESNVRKMGLTNVDLHIMDAERLEFRGNYFHSVMCSFALFLMPDMVGALREWKRVVRPGGRIIFTAFSAAAFQPMGALLVARLKDYDIDLGGYPESVAWRRLAAPSECRVVLDAAGLSDTTVETEPLGYHLRDVEEWWEIVCNSGFCSALGQLSEPEHVRLKSEHLAQVAELVTTKGLWLNVETHFAMGHKPTAETKIR